MRRVKIRLVSHAKDYKKYVTKPSFVSQKIFSENFVALHKIKPVLTLDKQIQVGFTISYLSKFLMYEFHNKYCEIAKKNGHKDVLNAMKAHYDRRGMLLLNF